MYKISQLKNLHFRPIRGEGEVYSVNNTWKSLAPRSWATRSFWIVAAFVAISATGCTRVGLNRNTPLTTNAGISGQPAQAVTAGGSITSRKQTSIGLSTRGGSFSSTNFRAIVGVQGSLYEQR